MKRLLKSNRGMTLMEILVALSLLMIIIVGTTPVMLQAYEGLYTAGEYTQNVYNAKTEVEDQLATRSSIIEYPEGFVINFENLGEVARVNAKRAVSSLKTSLETLFTGARVRIYISSGSVVDDNQSEHTLVLQTVNLAFTKDDITDEKMNNKAGVSKDGKKIDITAYLPNKAATANTAATVYTENRKAKVTVVNDTTNPDSGRIGIKISSDDYPIDFTTSPIKILVTYLDENDKVKSVHTYLTIKTPSIMFAGETSDSITYYTSAGVKEIRNDEGIVIERSLDAEARKMNIGYNKKADIERSDSLGASSTQVVPANTVFKSINWITEYARKTPGDGESESGSENVEYANTSYEPEYYVLTGTNGAIYRTYTFTDPNSVKGKVDLDTTDNDILGINGLLLNDYTKKSQNGKDVMGIADTEIYLDDRASTVVYPAVWGGDFSHIFGWSSYNSSSNTAEMGYIARQSSNSNPSSSGTWQTEHSTNKGTGQPGFYSNLASFGYYYNGWGASTKYYTMNSRKISYILTEVPNSMRIGGNLNGSGSSSGSTYGYDGYNYDRIWERPLSDDLTQSWEYPMDWGEAFFYTSEQDQNLVRSIMINPRNNFTYDDDHDADKLKAPVYLKEGDGNRPDNGMAQLRLKALTTLSPDFLYNRLNVQNDYNSDDASDVKFVYNNSLNKSKITITDAVYIPATDTTDAQVFYIGSVAAYGWVNQVDNVGTNDSSPDVWEIHEGRTKNTGRMTSYWVVSNDDGTSTAVHKYSSYSDSADVDHTTSRTKMMHDATWPTSTPIKANEQASHDFYISIPVQTVNSKLFSDVAFTLGYTSNREMVYGNIVYGNVDGKLTQSLKFCEPYYFQSHYGASNKVPNLYMNDVNAKLHSSTNTTEIYRNHPDNDYYNVWFPGEMYNLRKTATKDNVTVAVGYAVSGSTYTYLNSKENGSTGLGAIYNDGVIAGMVLGRDNAFKSLLYFKDPEFDNDSLTSDNYKYTRVGNNNENIASINAYTERGWTYGTHARDSVQFTCVDISIVQVGDYYAYYAYYADNKGRVFRSFVAHKHKEDAEATMASYVSDQIIEPVNIHSDNLEAVYNGGVGRMEQILIGEGDNKEPFTNYFSEIKAITCDDKHIVITGKSANEDFNIVVGTITDVYSDDGTQQLGVTITWKNVKMSDEGAEFSVEDMTVVGDYVYAVGKTTGNTGFIWAVDIKYLDTLSHNGEIAQSGATTNGYFFWSAPMPVYAVAGKE